MPHSVPDIPDDLPDAHRATVLGYDAELDALHPGWRRRVPFGHLDYPELARAKWLLKRRELLLNREGPPGSTRPAPRDWTVRVVPCPGDPRRCFVVPVDPRATRAVEREITTEPPSVRP